MNKTKINKWNQHKEVTMKKGGRTEGDVEIELRRLKIQKTVKYGTRGERDIQHAA